jgi:hypothetical protein
MSLDLCIQEIALFYRLINDIQVQVTELVIKFPDGTMIVVK